MPNIFCRITKQSPKALLVKTHDQSFWIPKSLIEEIDDPLGFDSTNTVTISVSDIFELPQLKTFKAVVKRETDKAINLEVDGKSAWFPRTQIIDIDYIDVSGQDCLVTVAEWLYKDKFGG